MGVYKKPQWVSDARKWARNRALQKLEHVGATQPSELELEIITDLMLESLQAGMVDAADTAHKRAVQVWP